MSTMRISALIIKSIMLLSFMMLSSCSAPGGSSDLPAGVGGTGVGSGTGVSVSSNPSSVSTYGLASVTATVRDATGTLVADGTSVAFSLSDATKGVLSSGTATTTGGSAKVNFTAANKTGNVSITATSGGLTGSVSISISASSTSAVSLMASPSAIPVSGTSTITTKVVDSTGNPVVDGAAISFILDDPTKGSLSSASAFTSNGAAVVTFTASSTASGTVKVTATSGSTSGEISLTITGGVAGGTMTLAASPTSVTTNGTTTISATLKDSSGNAISGTTVSFTLNNTAATLASPSAVTDATGVASATLTAGSSAASVTVTATASTLTGLVTVSITPATGVGSMTLSASPTTISTSSTSTITATIKDGANNPVPGVTVAFSLSNSAATIYSYGTTNASGVAQVVLTSGNQPTSVTVSATATTGTGTLNGTTTVTIQAPLPASVTLAANPSSVSALGTVTVTATVKDGSGNAVIDSTGVSFALSSPNYGALSSATTTTANGNGTATTTFTASNIAGTVTVTATAGTISVTTPVTVIPASTGSIQFISATPQVIGIKSSGQPASSAVKFQVKDINGNPVTDGTAVSLIMKGPGGGEYIGDVDATPSTATGSTVGGFATVILNSGSIAGPVTVTASTNVNAGTPTTLSAAIDATQTTITVASTTALPFPDTGRIRIDNELIDYTGRTATTFTGCTRGAVSTIAISHASGAKVYNQDTISSAATQISIGGGVPSATHYSLAIQAGKINLPGLLFVNEESQESTYMADRFGNYNILTGTSTSFYTEGGAIDRQGTAGSTGKTTVTLRTQNPMPVDVARALAGDALSNAYFGGANEPWYTSGSLTYNPRDGWVDVLAVTQGEEKFFDENVDGLFTRSYSTAICPYGATCECDGGVTNGYSTYVSGGAACAVGKRSEGFVDLGEPFYDVNDDRVRDDGLTSGKPFELYIDANLNGLFNTPNGMWDGPDCQSATCEKNKMIWLDTKHVFSGNPVFYPLPDVNKCYNLVTENAACSATYDPDYPTNKFAIAPASIAKGSFGSFTVIVGDINLNRLQGGTTVKVTASTGTVAPSAIPAIIDGLSTGPSAISFSIEISLTETKTISTVVVEVTTPKGVVSSIQVVVPII